LGYAARCGPARRGEAVLEQMLARTRRGNTAARRVIASVYVGLGDKDQALAWLNRAVDDRTWTMFLLRVEPTLDPLRSDPRFRGFDSIGRATVSRRFVSSRALSPPGPASSV